MNDDDGGRVRGFLLDTNHVAAYCRNDPKIIANLRKYPVEWLARVCAITLGEIEHGHLITTTTDQAKRNDYIKCFTEEFLRHALEISKFTRFKYGLIISQILRDNPMTNPDTKTERHLVQACGVDINDVWTVASAWEHKLIFCTTDKMAHIRKAVKGNVQFANLLDENHIRL
jgi:predicted nucleic acid-binding protein